MIGLKFGKLTVLELRRGAKNVHPVAVCRCECGGTRTVRQSRLRLGAVTQCSACALRAGWSKRQRNDKSTRRLLEQEGYYKGNAQRKGLAWSITRESFQAFALSVCRYCGTKPAWGLDRLDSAAGYVRGNVVPCCSDCNYAKRRLSEDDFLSLIRRIYQHSCQK